MPWELGLHFKNTKKQYFVCSNIKDYKVICKAYSRYKKRKKIQNYILTLEWLDFNLIG